MKIKGILAILLVLTLLLTSLVACGRKKDEDDETKKETEEKTEEKAEETEKETTEEEIEEETEKETAEEDKRASSEGLEFKTNPDLKGYTLIDIGTCKTPDIVIDMYNGLPVTSIGSFAFSGCTGLTSVTIVDSVTSIGYEAFFGCTGLTSVTISDSVTSIGSSAFSNCTGLTSIEIPNSVTSIESGAFYNTAYYNNESNWENDVLYIGNHLITAEDTISGAYTIKEGTKNIAVSAFDNRTGLTSITIPDSVTSIGEWAFYTCTGLKNVTFENTKGWKAGGTEILSKDLKDSAKAATYLTKSYRNYSWTRK